MRLTISVLMLIFSAVTGAASIKSVSNADNDFQKHQQVLASRLLSWSTGSKEQINYVSVGRYANYFGFVKMRVSSSHSLKRSETGRETLSVLTDDQIDILLALLQSQRPFIEATHRARLQANDYLDGFLTGKQNSVDRQQFLELAASYAVRESELGEELANGFIQVMESLSVSQIAALQSVREKHTSGTASNVSYNPPVLKSLSREDKQEIFNLASRMLSWVTGDLEDFAYETIGKPSQHFGFVSMRVESNHGVKRGVIADKVKALLSTEQNAGLQKAAHADQENLQAYLQARTKFLFALDSLKSDIAQSDSEIKAHANEMAALEARMTWDQAVAMKAIISSLNAAQSQQLIDLRKAYTTDDDMDGTQLYRQCAMCHQNQAIAPTLDSIVNRPIGDAGFEYSSAMRAYATGGKVWDKALLQQFITNPQRTIPGTIMGYKGVEDQDAVQSLIEYLEGL